MDAPNCPGLSIGWATRDATPDRPAVLGAQFHMRVSEGVDGPVTVTAMALSTEGPDAAAAVFVSCDTGGFRHRWYDENDFLRLCREAISEKAPDVDLSTVILNATHTHTAPNTLINRYGEAPLPDGVATADECMLLLRTGIAEAVAEAWASRTPGGVSYELGTAIVGHNRRATCFVEDSDRPAGAVVGGFTRMYGDTNDPAFSHIEGYEDHYVDLLYTWDGSDNLTGVVVNLACPSQETESAMYISADFWHEIRQELRRRHGSHIQVLAQCSAAGDQSPHRLWYKAAEERMLALRGLTMREEIGRRVADAVDEVLPVAAKCIHRQLQFGHIVREIRLPRRMVSDEEAAAVHDDLDKLEAEARAGKNNYRVAQRARRVLERYEQQKQSPEIPMELHLIRLGDMAFATNRFELFLDYGIRIKARSPAVQTFLIQLTANDGWDGTYLPSERAIANRGYGGGVYDNEVGPEGGRVIVEETLKGLLELWGG